MKKIYIGYKDFTDPDFKVINNIEMLKYIAADAECNIIILDGFLRCFRFSEVPQVIAFCVQKIRMGGVLKIIDIDFDLLSYTYLKINDIGKLQNIFERPISSFLNVDTTKQIVEGSGKMVHSGAVIKGIEFDMEFTRIS